MDDVVLIEQSARDIDEPDFQVAIDLTNGGIDPVDSFAVEGAGEGLVLFVDFTDVVVVVESELV